MLGLLKQKTHEEISEEKRLHLVELLRENHFYPTVLASPSNVKKPEEIDNVETLDFKQHCFDGRVRDFYEETRKNEKSG